MSTQALVPIQDFDLVIHNPKVVSIAERLHWKPVTAIRRIKSALPSPLEQQIYLSVATDFGILPESMAKLLRIYLGNKHLMLEDLEFKEVGNNLCYSNFNEFSIFLSECLNLLKIITNEYSVLGLSIEQAGRMVLHYGTDDPEMLIELVDNNLETMCEFFGISSLHDYGFKMRVCIWIMIGIVIPDNRNRGMMDPLDLSCLWEMSSGRRNSIREALSQQTSDPLSDNFYSAERFLKKEGLVR